MLFLNFGPATKVGDIDQFKGGKARHIGGIRFGCIPTAVEILEDDRLGLWRVKKVQIGLCQFALGVIVDIRLNHRDRWFGQNRD